MLFCLRIFLTIYILVFYVNAKSVVNKVEELRGVVDKGKRETVDDDWAFNEENILDAVVSSQLGETSRREDIRIELANRIKSYMDMLADPCDDFYQYACGNWEKKHPIPEENFEYNIFSLLQENLYISLKKLLLAKPSVEYGVGNDTSAEDKAKYFYWSCMNSEMRKKHGEKPLLDFLLEFGSWPALNPNWEGIDFDWIDLSGRLAQYVPNSLIRTSVDGDLKESNKNIIYIDEPTLTLPRRDIYLMESNSTYITAYRQLIIEVVKLLGASEESAEKTADEIIEFEKQVAKIKTEPQSRMELEDLYNKMTVSSLIKNYPSIDWLKYLRIIYGPDVNNSTIIILLSKEYMKLLPDLLAKADKRTICNYILWRYVKQLSEDLDDRFSLVHNKFSQVLTGQADATPKWKSCIHYTNLMLGMAVGAIFVRQHFDESSKIDVIHLTRELQQSFRDALHENTWIDEATRKIAEEKANKVVLAVGYPDDILIPEKLNKRYAELEINPNNYFQNSLNLGLFHTKQSILTLSKPVDREEWAGYPAVINAYFEQSNNRIIIPAGVLQPPVYSKDFPRALNYGGIGIFVGHELTHGFDDTGRNFDKEGDMKQWWTENSIEAFKTRGQCFEDQYSKFSIHGKNINGLLSKGENIADNGGLRQAFRAYTKWLEANPNEVQYESLPGFNLTDRKLFFLGFAQIWCGTIRPEAVDNKLETDAHSPGKYRVLGTLRNFEEFAKEFRCAEGTPMNPSQKCKLW